MRLSTRSQLVGEVENVHLVGVMASVKVRLTSDEIHQAKRPERRTSERTTRRR
jgi:hypothetical protein